MERCCFCLRTGAHFADLSVSRLRTISEYSSFFLIRIMWKNTKNWLIRLSGRSEQNNQMCYRKIHQVNLVVGDFDYLIPTVVGARHK